MSLNVGLCKLGAPTYRDKSRKPKRTAPWKTHLEDSIGYLQEVSESDSKNGHGR